LGATSLLSMGAVFGVFGGFYYWFGKITGYHYNELLGKIQFWVIFLGVNILAPINLAWCWNVYVKGLSYFLSNPILVKILSVDGGK